MMINTKKGLGSLLLAFFVILPQMASAETVLRTGSDISVNEAQVVEGDYYVAVGPFGRTVMSGNVAGDMLTIAGSALINGSVGQDLLLLAGTSQIHATVTDDVRVLGAEVIVSEAVGGDLFVVGGTLQVLSTASIEGNIYFFGGSATIEGEVKGSVNGMAEMVKIDGVVGEDVNLKVQNGLTLGDKAAIAGSLTYTSSVPLVRSPNASVAGQVQENEFKMPTNKEAARAILTPLFIALFTALSLYLLMRPNLERLVTAIDKDRLPSLLTGSAVAIAAPVATALLLVTVLGMLLGVLLLSGLIVLYVAAAALSGVVFGAFLHKLWKGATAVTLPTIVVGTICMELTLFVPVVGWLLFLLIFILTLGGIARTLLHLLRDQSAVTQ